MKTAKPSADVRAARQEIVENLREAARYYYGMEGSTAIHDFANKIEREMMDHRLSHVGSHNPLAQAILRRNRAVLEVLERTPRESFPDYLL